MEDSLWWLIAFLSVFLSCFVLYLVLSTCLGPPLIRAARSWLATHYCASKRDEWDSGGGGYREVGRRRGFLDGRGGQEGYEMASFGGEE
ncbi:hypothetical protein JCM8547_009126 [Rhodosporidiobolus lusitaniae]